MAMRLGEDANIDTILLNFHSTFGNVSSQEAILKKFHGCSQEKGESVAKYASRVEELFSQAVELKALERTQQAVLKCVFYEGLFTSLKVASMYTFENVKEYNAFKAEVRTLEAESSGTTATCNPL